MVTDLREYLGQRIRLARGMSNLSEIQLCKLVGTSKRSLARWESGAGYMSAVSLWKVARELAREGLVIRRRVRLVLRDQLGCAGQPLRAP